MEEDMIEEIDTTTEETKTKTRIMEVTRIMLVTKIMEVTKTMEATRTHNNREVTKTTRVTQGASRRTRVDSKRIKVVFKDKETSKRTHKVSSKQGRV